MRIARPLAILLFLLGCGGDATPTDEPTSGAEAPPERYDVPSGDVQAALAGAHRTDEERARDRWRHPAETLAFPPTLSARQAGIEERAPGASTPSQADSAPSDA